MSDSPRPRTVRPSWSSLILRRGLPLAAALGLFGLLATARVLQPAAEGMGTHRQLGLPPCSVQQLWGVRCPACGMTTSWAYFVRGQWIASAGANAGGWMLALVTLTAIPVLARAAWTGSPLSYQVVWYGAWVGIGILAVTLTDWIVRLTAG